MDILNSVFYLKVNF